MFVGIRLAQPADVRRHLADELPVDAGHRNMRLLVDTFLTLLLAAAIGLSATWFALTRGVAFGSLTIGAWTAWPKSGSQDIDPYAHATIARDGELPIGMGDGVSFFARTDDQGHEFDGRCTFALSGRPSSLTRPSFQAWEAG